ncbi:MAG: hypothetical protein M0Z68_01420 [Gammaproteobacteria bacterium]|nr:hypothetical protein [Gammaproteobacteria bacterium]
MNPEKSRAIINDLLEFARKYAEQNDDADDVDKAWDAIDAARLFLAQPESTVAGVQLLATLKTNGVEFSDCVAAFAEDDDNPYVVAGREMMDEGDLEMDAKVVISKTDAGAWVLAWKWVSNEDASLEEAEDESNDEKS